ncbi:MAG: SGNH/GDSL hydrolase family protein [Eubacteriales bacterium]|nr:SGNH/GDSL hydrolase family protein [Eubacteriales bacterium]
MNTVFKINDIWNKLYIHGRTTKKEDCLALDWIASGFDVAFCGNRIMISFGAYGDDVPVYVKVILDACEHKFSISDGNERIVIENLDDKEHYLTFLRVSEVRNKNMIDGRLLVADLEVCGENPMICEKPSAPNLRMAFFGDSITCGYGVLGSLSDKDMRTCDEDATLAYAYLTAKHFHADYRICSISGQGIVKDCCGAEGHRIPAFFDEVSRETRVPYDHSEWIPHVVVVNAGTNDRGAGQVTSEDFLTGAKAFINRIRTVYPDAYIVWMYGVMKPDDYRIALYGLEKEIRETDKKFFYLSVAAIDESECGTHAHPNVKGQRRAADTLIKFLSDKKIIE